MIRYLTEEDVDALLDVPTAIDLLEGASRKLLSGEAMCAPRQRVASNGVTMNVLPAALDGRVAHKTYPVARPRGATFWVTLFGNDGRMLALIEADKLGQLRTGAASGLATRELARGDAALMTIVGTGWQARTQVAAVAHVRPLERVFAHGRNADHTRVFCAEMSETLGIPVVPSQNLALDVGALAHRHDDDQRGRAGPLRRVAQPRHPHQRGRLEPRDLGRDRPRGRAPRGPHRGRELRASAGRIG